MGAWIETALDLLLLTEEQSLPMWERGLKLLPNIEAHMKYVAPHVGAWIETLRTAERRAESLVAPHVGAWIETLYWL